jgi:hypothetical protein
VWTSLREWILVDGEVPVPAEGSIMRDVGLRLSGDAALSTDHARIMEAAVSDQSRHEYQITGVVEHSQDIQTDDGNGAWHAGCEVLVVVDGQRLLITTSGRALDLPPSAHVIATGPLSIVALYEWDDFQLPDARADWLVRSITGAGQGDFMLDLFPL